ncbi:E3 ubiquitin-protein ligase TRIM39-like [Lepisosteus oculatus]|uniref:E3 ubiquitin-protein ligase TRIM39-like n=1 Tax=Lepisosteus oculatus TaxID=7918 RepID=UPI003721A78A
MSKKEKKIPRAVLKWIRGATADVILDPTLKDNRIEVSDEGKHVAMSDVSEKERNHLRFTAPPCVLGTEGLMSGRHYWEVEVRDNLYWVAGIFRGSADRRQPLSHKNAVWAVQLWNGSEFSALSDSVRTTLPLTLYSKRVGFYVNCEEQQLSFYNTETLYVIHNFKVHFTEKYYPLFCTADTEGLFVVVPKENKTYGKIRKRLEKGNRETRLDQDWRVGVYVDCEEGQLSFYNAETLNLIYTANLMTFVHPTLLDASQAQAL